MNNLPHVESASNFHVAQMQEEQVAQIHDLRLSHQSMQAVHHH